MSKDYKAITQDIAGSLGTLRAKAPLAGFNQLAKQATEAGALDVKTKELIALAIGITQHCDGCIGFHMKKLVELGATSEEIAETLAMCTYMGGGPALMFAADAWKAFEQFSNASE